MSHSNTQKNRLLANDVCERIDRSKPILFSYGGKSYSGFVGDTVASALLANGVDIIGRSFKYSRPRGILAAGADEPNAILQMGAEEATQVPNVRATQQELFEGLVCSATNGWPSETNDLMGYIGKLGGNLMTPGFYYKTFMYPKSMWKTYEKFIRKAAGLGRSSTESDPDAYEHINRHCDVLIVGAGPAGLAAAIAAARSGASVIIADEQSEFGGSLLHSKELIDGQPAQKWVSDVVADLAANESVVALSRSTVNGYHDHNFLTIHERCTDHIADRAPKNSVKQVMHRVRAKWTVLATGAHERPLVFANNDVPGVMLASAISTYINRFAVIPGESLVLMTTNDYAYQTAIDWFNAGRKVVAVVDVRANPQGERVAMAKELGIQIITGSAVIDVQGSKRVKAAVVAPINDSGDALTGDEDVLPCDTIASSGGWSPAVHLSCHTGSRPIWDEEALGFVPGKALQQQLTAGGINGHYALQSCLQEGFSAGVQAAINAGFKEIKNPGFATHGMTEEATMGLFEIPHSKPTSRAPKKFVDMQNDVTASGVQMATREGFESIEHVKRYTALGFGTDQGKSGNINGMAIVAKSLNQSIEETGTTIFRPNYTPTTFGAIAGQHCADLV